MFMYSYHYVCSVLYILFSSCQLAFSGYPDRVFFRVSSTAVRQMPGYNWQRRGSSRTLSKLIVLFYVLFVCKCVLYYCHQVSTQLQLTNVSMFNTINKIHKPMIYKNNLPRSTGLSTSYSIKYKITQNTSFRKATKNRLTEIIELRTNINVKKGHAVAQLVDALRYKSEGRWFDPRWCH